MAPKLQALPDDTDGSRLLGVGEDRHAARRAPRPCAGVDQLRRPQLREERIQHLPSENIAPRRLGKTNRGMIGSCDRHECNEVLTRWCGRGTDSRMASDRVRFRIGPIPAASARSWLRFARQNLLRVMAARDEALPFRLPEEVADHFTAVLDAWTAAAETNETFDFEDELDVDTAARMFVYWLNLTSFSDDQRTRLGLVDPPRGGAVFADAVRASLLRSLAHHDDLEHLAEFARTRQQPL
jgi:hypothetical protein